MTKPRKITSKYLESLKCGRDNRDEVIEADGRGRGSLIVRVTNSAKPFYFRYFPKGVRSFELVGYFDPKGAAHWREGDRWLKGASISLAAAREGYRELSQLATSVGNLKDHLAAEARRIEAKHAAAEAEARAGTFDDLLGTYVKHLRAEEKVSARDVERLFERCVRKPYPELIRRLAKQIKPEDVQEILARLVNRGVTREVNVARSYLHAAFAHATGEHDLDPRRLATDEKKFALLSNPVTPIPKIQEYERVGERALNGREIRAYLKLLDDEKSVPNLITRSALKMHLLTGGQRVRQLLSATWSDYDLKRNVVTLVDRKGRGDARLHEVPLLPEALEILETVRPLTGEAEWPFTTDGEVPVRHETLGAAVTEIRTSEEGGFPVFETSFTLKDIRRTVETTLASLGVSREHRAHLLSHGRGDAIAKAYDKHHYSAEKLAALNTWRNFLFSAEISSVVSIAQRSAKV